MASLKAKEVFCVLYSILLFITGLVLIAVSVVLCYKLFYHYKFVPNASVGPFILLFLAGFVHLFLTWLGVYGSTRTHDFHIILFVVLSIIVILGECAIGIWTIVLIDESDVETVLLMKESFEAIEANNNTNRGWDRLQSKLKCCGLNGFNDYKAAKSSILLSCYDLEIDSNITAPVIFEKGCQKTFLSFLKYILIEGAALSFSSCIFQCIGVYTFCVFLKALRKDRKDRNKRLAALQTDLANGSGDESYSSSYNNTYGRRSKTLAPSPPTVPLGNGS